MKFDISTALESASRLANKVVFKAKKHSPEILMVVGAVSIVAGTVKACKATVKMQDVLETTADTLEKIHGLEEGTLAVKEGETYTEEDAAKDKSIVYVQTVVKTAKLYAPAVILIGGGLGCMFGSHVIMQRRYSAAVAAYTAVSEAFSGYKARVKERFGEDVQQEIERGVKATEVDTGEVDENGQPIKKTVKVADKDISNPYSALFDESTSSRWTSDGDYNRIFIRQVQNEANKKLRNRGYLFLNEVLNMLEMPITKVGQFAGWMFEPTNPNIDSFVDFGMYDMNDERKRAFLEGDEPSIWLNFNCDGSIINKI